MKYGTCKRQENHNWDVYSWGIMEECHLVIAA